MLTTKLKITALGITSLAILALPSAGVLAASTNTTINGIIGSTISVAASSAATGSAIDINVTPAGGSKISSAKDEITVNTNNNAGYTLTLSTTTTNRDLTKGPDAISPATGTLVAPAALGVNTWGYRVDNLGAFGAGPSSVLSNANSTALTFAGVPASGSADIIKESSSTANNEVTTVWYAMHADSSKPNGTYTNTVIYTATTK